MKIERISADAEWLLTTSRRNQPLATVRAHLGAYLVIRADPPDRAEVYARFIDAVNAVTPKTKRQRADRMVFIRGALIRRRLWED
jgi:hypothetical protein